MGKKIDSFVSYDVGHVYEFSVQFDGLSFLVIFGSHINGWFIAVPTYLVCVEAANPRDIFYNTESLSRVIDVSYAETLATAIWHFYKGVKHL